MSELLIFSLFVDCFSWKYSPNLSFSLYLCGYYYKCNLPLNGFFKIYHSLYLFVFGCSWVFAAAHAFLSLQPAKASSLAAAVRELFIAWLLLLRSMPRRSGSVVVAQVSFAGCSFLGSRAQGQQLWCTGLVVP